MNISDNPYGFNNGSLGLLSNSSQFDTMLSIDIKKKILETFKLISKILYNLILYLLILEEKSNAIGNKKNALYNKLYEDTTLNPILYEKTQDNDPVGMNAIFQDAEMHKLFASYINFDLKTIADEDKINSFLGSFNFLIENKLNSNQYESNEHFSLKVLEDTNQDSYEQTNNNVDYVDFDTNFANHLKTINLFTIEDYLNQSNRIADQNNVPHSKQLKFDKEIYLNSDSLSQINNLIEIQNKQSLMNTLFTDNYFAMAENYRFIDFKNSLSKKYEDLLKLKPYLCKDNKVLRGIAEYYDLGLNDFNKENSQQREIEMYRGGANNEYDNFGENINYENKIPNIEKEHITNTNNNLFEDSLIQSIKLQTLNKQFQDQIKKYYTLFKYII